ncbi:hypothetical protein H6F96_06495 [Microcoleus sp. FACHB-53]|nr:hypothetical protein [Microcoleus sp. FACHB-53]
MHPRFRFLCFTTTLLLSLSFWELPLLFRRSSGIAHAQDVMATLADGNYQFCSQPETKDSPFGSGVCFWFRKVNNRVVGNYGYPQSDDSICVNGEVQGNLATGEALAVSWPGSPWENIPQSPVDWDEEGRLKLNKGGIIHTSGSKAERIDWIQFRSAVLNFKGFYRYTQVGMDEQKIPESCSVKDITEALNR